MGYSRKRIHEKNLDLTLESVVVCTSDIDLSDHPNKQVFNNTGATGAVQFTLPAATVGKRVAIAKTENQTVTIVPSGTDTIQTDGGTITNDVNEVSICRLVCLVAGRWDIDSVSVEEA